MRSRREFLKTAAVAPLSGAAAFGILAPRRCRYVNGRPRRLGRANDLSRQAVGILDRQMAFAAG